MKKRRHAQSLLFLGCLPILAWLLVAYPLRHWGVIDDELLEIVFAALLVLALISLLGGALLLVIRVLRAARIDRYLERWGIEATGVLLEAEETGIRSGDHPVLWLTLEVHHVEPKPYIVELETLMPRYALHLTQPQTRIPLRVHPEKHRRVQLALDVAEVKPPRYGQVFDDEEEKLFAERGRRGMATILSLKDSGRADGPESLVEMELKIYLADEEPYEVTVELPLGPVMIERFNSLIDRSVECLVNPRDRRRVKLLHD